MANNTNQKAELEQQQRTQEVRIHKARKERLSEEERQASIERNRKKYADMDEDLIPCYPMTFDEYVERFGSGCKDDDE